MKAPRYVGKGDKPSASHINSIIDYLKSLAPIDSPTVKHDWTTNGVVSRVKKGGQSGATSTFDWSYFQHAPQSTDNASKTITFSGGRLKDGADTYSCSETEVRILGGTTASPQYVYGIYDEVQGEWEIAEDSISQVPSPSGNYWYIGLAEVYLSGGSPQYKKVLNPCTIIRR